MKKIIVFIVYLLVFISYSQSPPSFPYQVVVKDISNNTINNVAVGVQINIKQGTIGGTILYTESFQPVTNGFGLINLGIGTGSTADDFTNIDWANGPYFIETAIDVTGGTNYQTVGASQLMSVPYALHATTSGNGPGPIGAQGIDGEAGAAGLGGVLTSGTGITVTGTGTVGNPYNVLPKSYTLGYHEELGGYVFRVNANGRHGIVMTRYPLGGTYTEMNWNDAQNAIGDISNYPVEARNFSDWRIPTKFQLYFILESEHLLTYLANPTLHGFWSSTEDTNYLRAYRRGYIYDNASSSYIQSNYTVVKTELNTVIAIRYF